ncbi:MAG: SCP2 sterol-binding domain-containing protein [Methylococcaceae bacterium]
MSALSSALNQYLALANNREEFLAPLVGKVIAVTVTPFNETIYLCPSQDSIQLLDSVTHPADTTLIGSLFALGLMGFSDKPERAIFSGDVKIEGDIHTGRKLQRLFNKLDIGLEAKLAPFTGSQLAQQVSRLFQSGRSWSKATLDTWRLNLTEFLQEETRDLPASPEVLSYYQQVDELRCAADRLQSRVDRLQECLINKSATSDK